MQTDTKAWASARRVVEAGVAAGLDRRQLLGDLGVDSRAVAGDGGDLRVAIRRVFAVWEQVARRLRDPALPVRAGAAARLEHFHLMGFAILTAGSGHEALDRAIRYAPLITDAGRWEREDGDGIVTVRWMRDGERSLGHRLTNEAAIAQFVACMRQLCGAGFAPTRVAFRHAAPRAPRALDTHRDFFRAPIEFGEAGDEFSLRSRALDVVPAAHNPALAAFVRVHAEERLRARTASTRAAAYAAIARELRAAEGAPTIDAIAAELGTSERTLRRRLRDHGVTFRALVDEVRRERARALVAGGGRPLIEVALEVGFSDASAFSHAFRRWFGHAPRELRAASTRDR